MYDFDTRDEPRFLNFAEIFAKARWNKLRRDHPKLFDAWEDLPSRKRDEEIRFASEGLEALRNMAQYKFVSQVPSAEMLRAVPRSLSKELAISIWKELWSAASYYSGKDL